MFKKLLFVFLALVMHFSVVLAEDLKKIPLAENASAFEYEITEDWTFRAWIEPRKKSDGEPDISIGNGDCSGVRVNDRIYRGTVWTHEWFCNFEDGKSWASKHEGSFGGGAPEGAPNDDVFGYVEFSIDGKTKYHKWIYGDKPNKAKRKSQHKSAHKKR